MKVQCPNCKWSADVPDEKIPVVGATGTCPKCKTKFTFVGSVPTPSRLSNVETKIATETNDHITCPKCKQRYDISQFKSCPVCAKRVGYGCLVIIIIILVLIFRSCGSSPSPTTSSESSVSVKPTPPPIQLKSADEIAQEEGIPVDIAREILTKVKTDFPPVSQNTHLKQQVDAYKKIKTHIVFSKSNNALAEIISKTNIKHPGVDYVAQLSQIESQYNEYKNIQLGITKKSQIKSRAEDVSYDDLFRNNERHIQRIIHFRGQIEQISENKDSSWDIRIATKRETSYRYFGNTVYFERFIGPRFLKGDIVDIWGRVSGLKTFRTVIGAESTEPLIDAEYMELVAKQE